MERPRGLTDREWIDTLAERARQLADAMMPPMSFPVAWRLTPTHARMLRALIARAPHLVSTEAMCLACERPGADDPVSHGTLKVQMSKLRANLRQAGVNVTIVTVWGEGYALEAAGAAVLIEAAGDGPAYRAAA